MLKIIKKILRKKRKPINLRYPFAVKEISWQGRRLNLGGNSVSHTKMFNTDLPYTPILQGIGWDIYLQIKGIKSFDATVGNEDEMSNLRGVENLSELEIKI